MDWSPVRNVTLLVTAVVYGLLGTIALGSGLFGIWLGVLLVLSLWRYAYEVLRLVAAGRRSLPPPAIESMNPIGEIVLLLHFAAFPGVAILAFAGLPPWLALLAALALAGVFPASAGLMGLTSSIESAMNPLAIRMFVRTLGSDYLVLVLGCAAIVLGAAFIDGVVLDRLGILSRLVGMMLGVWVMLAVFAVIGSALHCHRTEFEIAGESRTPEQWEAEGRERERRAGLDRAYASIRSGLVEQGYRELRDLVAVNGGTLEIQYWLFENMLDWEDKRHAVEVAAALIGRLIAAGDMAAALELYTRAARHAVPLPLPSAEAAALAEFAAGVGRHGAASELVALAGAPPGIRGL